jgi:DNA-directed RNA polymerase specialized sigma24 family protein
VRRVRAWAGLRAFGLGRDAAEDVAQDTCAEIWRTFNLARGGASFEGFVQGRFVEALRRTAPSSIQGDLTPEGEGTRLTAALDELRARNPRHHRALALLYEAQATPEEAADELTVDPWALRSMIARARLALAQSLERPARGERSGVSERSGQGAEKNQRPSDKRRPAARGSGRPAPGKPRRPGRR